MAAKLLRLLAATGAVLLLQACDGLERVRSLSNEASTVAPSAAVRVAGGLPDRGRERLAEHGCTTCHAIPGHRRFQAQVGPPLAGFGTRTNIAGELPNQPELLVRFLMNSPREVPGTGMPNLRIDEAQARDIAAFLYTLR